MKVKSEDLFIVKIQTIQEALEHFGCSQRKSSSSTFEMYFYDLGTVKIYITYSPCQSFYHLSVSSDNYMSFELYDLRSKLYFKYKENIMSITSIKDINEKYDTQDIIRNIFNKTNFYDIENFFIGFFENHNNNIKSAQSYE